MLILDDPVAVEKLRSLWYLQDKLVVLERSLVAQGPGANQTPLGYTAPTSAELLRLLGDVFDKWELK